MEPCRKIRKGLSAYQDLELGLAEKTAIEHHLRTCEACRKEYGALLQTYRMLGILPAIDPPPGLFARIVGSATRPRKTALVQSPGKAFRWIPVPAAAIMLTAIGLFMGILLGSVLTERSRDSYSWRSASLSAQAPTIASIRVFDATPPGSFAEDYLSFAVYNSELRHEQ